jgi:B12 binding domain
MKSVLFVELTVFERMAPLTSGYLQAYALTEPVVRGAYSFDKYTATIRVPADVIVRDLLAVSADVYGFSCYVWNMGLIRTILAALREARPDAHIVLGGPQVMHHAQDYLGRDDERTVICNGEGEVTFTEYLCALTESRADLQSVNGISFYADGELVTTPERPRIKDLNSIPSPFLTGLFDPGSCMSVLETNRGCPFHCGFCYWGAATNDRVYRFDEQRIRDEITWMAKNEILFLYIADANWGMLSRDVEFSQHIAECAREYRLPNVIYFSAAKNKPRAVTQITSIFQEAGLVASQPVSLQTLEPASLDLIARSNIKMSAFAEVQEDLREKRISSFIELIWPLPGETLSSFKRGISTLCDNEAQTIIAYSHLLLNNTPIYRRRDDLALITRAAGGAVGDARIVVGTEQVSEAEFAEGMRYFYAVHALHNTRSLRSVGRYLTAQSVVSYAELFAAFVEFWRAQAADDPLVSYVETSIANADYYDINNYGLFVHNILHENRKLFVDQVRRFVTSQSWWADEVVQALFDVDMVNRPYVYSNTLMDPVAELAVLRVMDRRPRGYTVRVPPEYLPALADSVRVDQMSTDGVFTVDHKRMQFPFMAKQSPDHNGSYCHGMIEKVENIMPLWRSADGTR